MEVIVNKVPIESYINRGKTRFAAYRDTFCPLVEIINSNSSKPCVSDIKVSIQIPSFLFGFQSIYILRVHPKLITGVTKLAFLR